MTWRPPADATRTTRVGRFMSDHGIASIDELRERSVADPEWFWDATVKALGIGFDVPYTQVVDTSKGIAWATWFRDGRLNLASACVDAHAEANPEHRAIVWEGEDGEVRMWTYGELRRQSDAIAHLLAERGVGPGDGVGLFLPMVPETVAALMGVAKLGAVFLPLFSGYASAAIVSRLGDAEAKALITADGFYRRGKPVNMLATAREAAAAVDTLSTTVVVHRVGRETILDEAAGEVPWPEVGAKFETRSVDSEHTLFIAYTSGTTGKPKGSVHVHGGFLVKIAEEAAFQCDVGPADTVFWLTDIGWIMGPWQFVGGLANGATLALFEGAPDFPGPDRLWEFVERHRVSVLGVSPTLIRALMVHGDDPVDAHDLSSLRVLGSTGEPWNEAPWRWFFEKVGGGRCPVINISGGTEVGACFLSPHPVEEIAPMSLGGPSLGMAVDVFDDDGKPVRGQVGELVCTAPWPGMTRGLYRDPERYLDTYWSRWPDVWAHGDWASIDDEGRWFLHGRSDDTIKVAGKRLGPAEAESALVGHPAVTEAAAIGVPDDLKGEALWTFVVLSPGFEPSEELRSELANHVAAELGKSFKPSAVKFTTALPKTRNSKVLRRAVRAVVIGADLGDLSSLEDPATIEAVKAAT
ncbi:MAG TPA: AMP-binding protein [Acidimicrobiales bacterium]|nr:AMP-binding protein [Acidimicrobiales bacterium]